MVCKSGFDLASLNMQRGRDHGLPLYGEWKIVAERLCGSGGTVADLGYDRNEQFITDVNAIQGLEELYGNTDNADIWIAGLLEEFVERTQEHVTGRTDWPRSVRRAVSGARCWTSLQSSSQECWTPPRKGLP